MEFDYKILEEKFKQLPEHLQHAMTSVEISARIKDIGERHGLRIDQESTLYDLTGYVMLGLIPAADFVKNLSKEAAIDEKTAKAIADDINDQVLGEIRNVAREVQEEEEIKHEISEQSSNQPAEPFNQPDNSSLEKVGGFEVEKEAPEQDDRKTIDTDVLMQHIERDTTPKEPEIHTEPLVDHLLSNPSSEPIKKIEQQPPETPIEPQPEPKKSEEQPPKPEEKEKPAGPDPYRESPQ